LSDFKIVFGESAINFSDVSSNVGNSFISTGARTLNYILTGNPDIGIVQRRIYEYYGPEGCGKTTLGLESISSCQKGGGKAMIVDVEHALDPTYCKSLKINLNKCEVGEPGTMEKSFDMIQWGIENNFDLILVDSVAAMSPLAEIEGSMGDSNMGLHARLMGQGMRRVTSMITKNKKTSIIFTNQIRMKIGVLFGNPETRPGGKALKYFTSGAIVDLRDPRGQKTTENKIETGKIINAKTIKNKLWPPYQKCKIYVDYGKGVNKKKDLMQILKDKGVCEFTKKTITLEGYTRMSINDFSIAIKEDKELRKYIKEILNGE
jgi:recombination protein RecA